LHYKDPVEDLNPTNPQDEKALMVQLADLIVHSAGIGSPEGYKNCFEDAKKLAPVLGFDTNNLDATLTKIIEETKEKFIAESNVYS
jgi:ADP-ribosylglycohydrolase